MRWFWLEGRSRRMSFWVWPRMTFMEAYWETSAMAFGRRWSCWGRRFVRMPEWVWSQISLLQVLPKTFQNLPLWRQVLFPKPTGMSLLWLRGTRFWTPGGCWRRRQLTLCVAGVSARIPEAQVCHHSVKSCIIARPPASSLPGVCSVLWVVDPWTGRVNSIHICQSSSSWEVGCKVSSQHRGCEWPSSVCQAFPSTLCSEESTFGMVSRDESVLAERGGMWDSCRQYIRCFVTVIILP